MEKGIRWTIGLAASLVLAMAAYGSPPSQDGLMGERIDDSVVLRSPEGSDQRTSFPAEADQLAKDAADLAFESAYMAAILPVEEDCEGLDDALCSTKYCCRRFNTDGDLVERFCRKGRHCPAGYTEEAGIRSCSAECPTFP